VPRPIFSAPAHDSAQESQHAARPPVWAWARLLYRPTGRFGGTVYSINPARKAHATAEVRSETPIDRWVTEHALRLPIDGERVAINLAGPSIGDERILALVQDALADGLNPANVIFEITETAAVSNFERAERFARTLNDIGCNLALDDFGTGFGSFTYLKYVNARYLKIDLEFVRHLVRNDTDQKVVKSIVDIAHSLEKKTIAEGVEDAATLSALKHRGVDFAQGFYLGRPKRLSLPKRLSPPDGPINTGGKERLLAPVVRNSSMIAQLNSFTDGPAAS
jgi:EAL domain-containing protein (putative c-di-GMP-specific phosphodiesterase class I)